MRRYAGKKYKRIIAGLLAASLIISTTSTGMTGQTNRDHAASVYAENLDVQQVDEENTDTAEGLMKVETGSETETTSEAEKASEDEMTTEVQTEEEITEAGTEEKTVTTEEIADSTDSTDDSDETSEEAMTTDDSLADPESGDPLSYDADAQSGDYLTPADVVEHSTDKTQTTYNETANSITIFTKDDLILLSNCDPELLSSMQITIGTTGSLKLNSTDKVTYNGKTYTYKGIGRSDHPFAGSFRGTVAITAYCPIFSSVSSSADLTGYTGTFYWSGTTSTPMFADEYVFDDAESHDFPFTIKPTTSADSTMGTLIGEIRGKAGVLIIKGNKVSYKAEKDSTTGKTPTVTVKADNPSGNSGMVCNTLTNGTVRLDGYQLPTDITVIAKNGSAGAVIGTMAAGTTLVVNSGSSQTITGLTVTASGTNGNAGGLVGTMNAGADITMNAAISVGSDTATGTNSKIQITGSENVGGLVGYADTVTFDSDNDSAAVTWKNPTVKGTDKDAHVGGVFGTYVAKGQDTTLPSWNKQAGSVTVITNGSSNTSPQGLSGGIFGLLELEKKDTAYAKYSISDVSVTCEKQGEAGAYGAVAGRVTGAGSVQNALILTNININSYYNNGKAARYHGGLVGELGKAGDNTASVYMEVDRATITIDKPYAGDTYGIGGITGRLCQESIIKTTNTVTIKTTSSDPRIWEGGGLIGCAESGSILELNGTTDLSGVSYDPRFSVGQIVGHQDGALIYARGNGTDTGWVLKRAPLSNMIEKDSKKQLELDDIGNYGEVIRLQTEEAVTGLPADMITMDPVTHAVSLKQVPAGTYTGDTITLSSAEDFARLAITWQSRGAFSADPSLSASDWNMLYSKNIILNGDIDLTGSGILGLTRDYNDANKDGVYSGTFDGKNHTLTLAIGEAYGIRGEQKAAGASSGTICAHPYSGIFAISTGDVRNLKLAGSIHVAAMPYDRGTTGSSYDYYIGGFAGKVTGNGSGKSAVSVDGVTSSIKLTIAGMRTSMRVNSINAGGIFGQISENATIELGKDNAVISKTEIRIADIEATSEQDHKNIYAGGLIGSLAVKTITINCRNVTVSGAITGDSAKDIQAGGLIGYAEYGNAAKKINLEHVMIAGQTIKSDNADRSGGFLGYLWADTTVNIAPAETDTTGYAVEIETGAAEAETDESSKKSAISLTKSGAELGGLVYRASGYWRIADRGIRLDAAAFYASKLGLLVCHAEADQSQTDTSKKHALYLEVTADWDSAYKIETPGNISVAGSPVLYDEWVAYTAADAGQITTNGANGVISLATKNRIGVAEGTTINTYVNRINTSSKDASCSRYYYNLDQIRESEDVKNNTGKINNANKLLLWSVWTYACSNIQSYFKTGVERLTFIGDAGTDITFDMTGLSYYPVSVAGMTVKHANIIFDNETIERFESSEKNKSTTGAADAHSQHYMMHAGLFYNMTATTNVTTEIDAVTFSGTIGKRSDTDGAGALCCGVIEGSTEKQTSYTLTIGGESAAGLTLAGLRVWNAGSNTYAPVLINQIGSYAICNIKNINTAGYASGAKAGSSLIGQAGSDRATQISLGFTSITLPDEKENSIFTRATLLDSFRYMENGIGSAVYNFYKKEDWNEENPTEHIHNVTYGKEISDSSQYKGLQNWYYDAKTYKQPAGLVQKQKPDEAAPDFSNYLPYVYQEYDAAKHLYEIMVNQRVGDLVNGCGTYGHPYQITDSLVLSAVADYIASESPRSGWHVTITKDQTVLHTDDGTLTPAVQDEDITYEYDGTAWHEVTGTVNGEDIDWTIKANGGTISNTVMHRYVLSAYYDICTGKTNTGETSGTDTETAGEKVLTVENFAGFGTAQYPFRGVVTSSDGTILELKGAATSRGLIPYSYGSVVKDLTIRYTAGEDGTGKTVNYNQTDIDEQLRATTSMYQPIAFWGGVMGSILGGDNIIENVAVTYGTGWKLSLDGDRNYLTQVGGYVGSVAGGGVIFRKMSGKAGLTDNNLQKGDAGAIAVSVSDTANSYYVNPYVGRVLAGYAFSEGCMLNNGNKSYKINTLNTADTACVTTTATAETGAGALSIDATVNDAQGLLVLSAIVSSGAAAGGYYDNTSYGTYPYYGKSETYTGYAFGNGRYGKVRNASYSSIGKADETAQEDFKKAKSDDCSIPGYQDGSYKNAANLAEKTNAPYLVRTYCDDTAFYLSGKNSTVTFNLKDITYDMTGYKNGYQGISARYLSNAVQKSDNDGNVTGSVYVKPCVSGFNGNGAVIKADMQIKEYTDDDFHGISFGAVFNLIRTVSAASTENHILAQNFTIDGTTVTMNYYDTAGNVKGTPSNMDENAGRYCVGVGGFAGNSSANGFKIENETDQSNVGYVFSKIQILNSTFAGPVTAGGLMGSAGMGNGSVNTGAGILICNSKTDGNANRNGFGVNLLNCRYDAIYVQASYLAGGFVGTVTNNRSAFGYAGAYLNSSLNVTDADYQVVGKNSTIEATRKDRKYTVDSSDVTLTDIMAAGGVFGAVNAGCYVNTSDYKDGAVYNNSGKTLLTAKFEDITVTAVDRSFTADSGDTGKLTDNTAGNAGGIVGYVDKSYTSICDVELYGTTQNKCVISAQENAGGIVGKVSTGGDTNDYLNCKVHTLTISKAISGAGGIIGTLWSGNNHNLNITDSSVSDAVISGNGIDFSAGGLLGYLRDSRPVVVERCSVDTVHINQDSAVGYNGGIVGSMGYANNESLSIFDSTIDDTTIYGNNAGGICSSAYGNFAVSNLRISGTHTVYAAYGGILIGQKGNAAWVKGVYMAGISIKNGCDTAKGSGNPSTTQLIGDTSLKAGTDYYIAMADYTDAAAGTKAGKETDTLLGISSDKSSTFSGTAPYVVTSPKNDRKMKGKDGTSGSLYGDSTAWSASGTSFQTMAQVILAEKTNAQTGRFAYQSYDETDSAFESALATYNDNQTTKADDNFPVLQVTGGDASSIEQYANIITNGGYKQAKAMNGKNDKIHVTATADMYIYDPAEKVFCYSPDTPAIQVTGSGTSAMTFTASSDYDNDKDRFTLVTITFNEGGHSYHVQIPVLVRRILEVDFTATLSYGTHYNGNDYADLTSHILDSFGNSMTGYLTYTYNSAYGVPVPYGWQNYVNSGGDIAQTMEKSVVFRNDRFPVGTQLTLVDCQNPKRTAYYHTIEASEAGQSVFSFSAFTDSEGQAFSSGSIGERMGVQVEKQAGNNFICVDETGKPVGYKGTATKFTAPTVCKDGNYYRLAAADETGYDTYKVTISDEPYTENYYLVVTVPVTSSSNAINGYLETNMTGTIPYHINYLLRQEDEEGNKQTDEHSNTASTYQIFKGYEQNLEETLDSSVANVKVISAVDTRMKVSIRNSISFPLDQYYNSGDQLYQKFTGTLQTVDQSGNTAKIGYSQFPSSTSGTVSFYVYADINGTTFWYTYNEQSGWSRQDSKAAATMYDWVSTGTNMELPFSTDGSADHAISFQQVRDDIKASGSGSIGTFYVEAIMDISLPTSGLDVIPEGTLQNGQPDNYARLNYVSQISTERKSLSYSSMRKSLTNTKVQYYRETSKGSRFVYDADNINQLGINLLDLESNLDKDKKNAVIATTATYDLSAVQGYEKLLKESEGIRYTLTLSQKDTASGKEEAYQAYLQNAEQYMNITLTTEGTESIPVDYSNGIWSWTIPKDVYIKDDELQINSIFTGSAFVQNLNLLVDVLNVEDLKHVYANYQVQLKAEILGAEETTIDSGEDNVIYTLTKIKPEFESK